MNMKDDLREHEELIRQMQGLPKATPPEDFTGRLMQRLPVYQENFWTRVKQALLNPGVENIPPGWVSKQGASNRTECSFYFFLTGFFYLIMGLVLLAGFRAIDLGMPAMDWLRMQPHLTFGTALWLLVLGLVLLLDGKIAVTLARYGTLLYILFAMINGILIRPYFHVPYADFFIFGFIAGGVSMGIMLALAVYKMALRTV
jgi:hypothetical protein